MDIRVDCGWLLNHGEGQVCISESSVEAKCKQMLLSKTEQRTLGWLHGSSYKFLCSFSPACEAS